MQRDTYYLLLTYLFERPCVDPVDIRYLHSAIAATMSTRLIHLESKMGLATPSRRLLSCDLGAFGPIQHTRKYQKTAMCLDSFSCTTIGSRYSLDASTVN